MAPKLGIIAGSGLLPKKLVENGRATCRDCFVLAFEGETNPDVVAGVEHLWSRLGAAARNFAALRQAGVQEVIMAGGIRRASLAGVLPELRGGLVFVALRPA